MRDIDNQFIPASVRVAWLQPAKDVNMIKKYEVRYMSGGEGELLGENLSYKQAQALVRFHAEDMHEENAADLVIRSH